MHLTVLSAENALLGLAHLVRFSVHAFLVMQNLLQNLVCNLLIFVEGLEMLVEVLGATQDSVGDFPDLRVV